MKNIPARFQEWLAEIMRHSAFLGRAAEHFKGNSLNLAGRFLYNSVFFPPLHCPLYEPKKKKRGKKADFLENRRNFDAGCKFGGGGTFKFNFDLLSVR